MRTIRIYQSGEYQPGSTIALDEYAAQHVGVVLRLTKGEKITLFCGDNHEYEAMISSVHKKKVSVDILSAKEVNRESPLSIDLAQAISKGDRMEYVVQKSVELGVRSITPIITSRCVVKLDKDRLAKKISQWQAIAIAACEQSGRNQLPVIHSALAYHDYLAQNQSSMKIVLDPLARQTWRNYSFKAGALALVVGPEGGLSTEEMAQANSAGFSSLSLGPRILRTETAAIVAISVLQASGGDL